MVSWVDSSSSVNALTSNPTSGSNGGDGTPNLPSLPTYTTASFGNNSAQPVINFANGAYDNQPNGNNGNYPNSGQGLTLTTAATSAISTGSFSVFVVGDLGNSSLQAGEFVNVYNQIGGSSYGWALGIADGNPGNIKFFTAPGADSISGNTGVALTQNVYNIIGASYSNSTDVLPSGGNKMLVTSNNSTNGAIATTPGTNVGTDNPIAAASVATVPYSPTTINGSIGYVHVDGGPPGFPERH